MGLEGFTRWDGKKWFVLRLDYGWDVPEHELLSEVQRRPEAPGAFDLGLGLPSSLDAAGAGAQNRPRIAVLWGGEALLDLKRRNSPAKKEQQAKDRLPGDGVVVCARFPRTFPKVIETARKWGRLAGWAEMEPAGGIPPLYARLVGDDAAIRAHLRLEWETGVAKARATSVLAVAGAMMASEGEARASGLALRLGVTSGAARSYLVWMEEAGLCRRAAGGAYLLRHPALGGLFAAASERRPREPLPQSGAAKGNWIEID